MAWTTAFAAAMKSKKKLCFLCEKEVGTARLLNKFFCQTCLDNAEKISEFLNKNLGKHVD